MIDHLNCLVMKVPLWPHPKVYAEQQASLDMFALN